MDIKADFTLFDWAQMRFIIFICFVLYVHRICKINHSILGKHFIPFCCMNVSLSLSKQHISHRKLIPVLLDFPATVIMKGLQVFSSQPLSGRKLFRLFDRFRNREPINPSATSKTYLSVADWQAFVLFCLTLHYPEALMAANNWDIEIIKEETQTALYIRGTHQMALSIVFSFPVTCVGLHNMLFSNTPVRKYQTKLILVSIQTVTFSTKEEWEQQSKTAKS